MASSLKVYRQIIEEGLATKRQKNHRELARLLSEDVESDEAHRRVYWPWKSLPEYQAMMVEYEKAFAA
jgi:hypothetical protein